MYGFVGALSMSILPSAAACRQDGVCCSVSIVDMRYIVNERVVTTRVYDYWLLGGTLQLVANLPNRLLYTRAEHAWRCSEPIKYTWVPGVDACTCALCCEICSSSAACGLVMRRKVFLGAVWCRRVSLGVI